MTRTTTDVLQTKLTIDGKEYSSGLKRAGGSLDKYEKKTRQAAAALNAVCEAAVANGFSEDRGRSITGEVDRTTDFETGFRGHEAHRGNEWEADPLILDDQALVVHVRDQGLLALTGCGHAGAVNIARHAMRRSTASARVPRFFGFSATSGAASNLRSGAGSWRIV